MLLVGWAMNLATVALHDLVPGRIEPTKRSLAALFDGRIAWLDRVGGVLAIRQYVGGDDHTEVEQLRLDVAQVVLRAHCEPCTGSIVTYESRGPSTTLDAAALTLGLDVGQLSAVDQLGALSAPLGESCGRGRDQERPR